ncbi:MAG: thiamine phosphate synthase [Nitrosospira sp.]|nr:thiamine phosphate synthase [Nitrosospira sp.]MBI0412898.1 thiamine phosphate synthase [Nitrosospira sp.]
MVTKHLLPQKIEGLYAITPDVADTALLVRMTRQVLAGGARLVQYRNKTAEAELRLDQAQTLLNLCREHNVPLIINDHLDLAIAVGADGIHLGQDDIPVATARYRLGPEKIIGVSCYNHMELATEAEKQGVDYVAFGAFFVSPTKPNTVTAPMSLLRQSRQMLHVPVVAIGGITLPHVADLIRHGADVIAASSSLFGVLDTQSAAENFSRLITQSRHSIHHPYERPHDFT